MTSATIREESDEDYAAIAAMIAAAFGRPSETELVAALRADGHQLLSLVAEEGGAVVGHALFSRLDYEPDPGGPPLEVSGLAPLAVAPGCQGQGIGSALIREGLRRLTADGEDLCLVLGEPAYYDRFGFDATLAARFTCAFAGPYLMVRAFTPAGARTRGRIAYPAPFHHID